MSKALEKTKKDIEYWEKEKKETLIELNTIENILKEKRQLLNYLQQKHANQEI